MWPFSKKVVEKPESKYDKWQVVIKLKGEEELVFNTQDADLLIAEIKEAILENKEFYTTPTMLLRLSDITAVTRRIRWALEYI